MPISDKTRKLLWGKSGNRCAFCKVELTTIKADKNNLNIGEECHIVSSKSNGPRYKPSLKDYDIYDNLILLCRNHHKEIDTLVDAFPEDILRAVKNNHENWVRESLSENIESTKKQEKVRFLTRITTGKELSSILFGSYGYRMDCDQPCNNEEADYLGGILQTLQDYGEIGDSLEVFDKIKAIVEFQNILDELETKNYIVYGERTNEPFYNLGSCPISTVVIKRIDTN